MVQWIRCQRLLPYANFIGTVFSIFGKALIVDDSLMGLIKEIMVDAQIRKILRDQGFQLFEVSRRIDQLCSWHFQW